MASKCAPTAHFGSQHPAPAARHRYSPWWRAHFAIHSIICIDGTMTSLSDVIVYIPARLEALESSANGTLSTGSIAADSRKVIVGRCACLARWSSTPALGQQCQCSKAHVKLPGASSGKLLLCRDGSLYSQGMPQCAWGTTFKVDVGAPESSCPSQGVNLLAGLTRGACRAEPFSALHHSSLWMAMLMRQGSCEASGASTTLCA